MHGAHFSHSVAHSILSLFASLKMLSHPVPKTLAEYNVIILLQRLFKGKLRPWQILFFVGYTQASICGNTFP
jgi:hypothetical protein